MSQIQLPFALLLYACIVAIFIGPFLMICIRKRRFADLLYLPMAIWYAWSVPYPYLAGNLSGIFRARLDWFRTPKLQRRSAVKLDKTPKVVRALYGVTFAAFIAFYSTEGWAFGWIDMFALIWLPSMLIASVE